MSAFVELMKTTMTLSANLGINPFEILDRDVDDVIMIIDFYIELGAYESTNPKQIANTNTKETRIRVNDKTATGGWF